MWIGAGSGSTAYGMADTTTSAQLNLFLWSSWHTAGVNFAFADGSVKVLRRVAPIPPPLPAAGPLATYPPEWFVFQELAGWADGGVRDTVDLID